MSKFASLSAGLLARKGQAEPASTPFADELLTRVGSPAADIRALTPMPHGHAASARPPEPRPLISMPSISGSFGRRGMQEIEGARSYSLPPTNFASGLHREYDEQADTNCGACASLPADDGVKSYHVNLRLKRLRFVKLKLSAALLRRPVQDIVAEALDQWFERLPPDVMGECACLKARGE